MATKIIWGYINADGSVKSGTGDFTVVAQKNTGFYDVTFDPDSFNDQPAITGTAVSTNEDAPVFYVYEMNSDDTRGFTAEIRNASSEDRRALDFMFNAIGSGDD